MADEVTATFHYGEGKTVSETYSVAQYIEKFDSIRDKYDAATQAVVDAIADYGHFMQIVLARTNGWEIGKDHAEMAGSSSFLATAENLAAVKAAVSDHAFTWNVESSKIEDFTFDLTLDSSTTLRVFFTPEEGFAGEFTAYLSEGSKNLAVLQGNGRYLVTIPDIPAHLLGQKFMVSGQAGGEYYVILSPLTYIDTVLGLPAYQNDQDMQNAMVALYEYYRTVMEYRKR